MRSGCPIAGMMLALLLPAVVLAQNANDPLARRQDNSGPGLDSVRVALAAQPTWRGFLLGPSAIAVFADFPLAGRPVTVSGDWGLAAHVQGTAVRHARPNTISSAHYGGGLTVFRYYGDVAVALASDLYHLPDASADRTGVEIGVRVTELEWNWGLEEVNPKIAVGLYRDLGRFDAFRADVDFNVGLGIQNVAFWIFRDVAGWIEARAMWNEYDHEAPGHDDLGWRAGVGGNFDAGIWSLSIRAGGLDPLDAGARGFAELAINVNPLGREF